MDTNEVFKTQSEGDTMDVGQKVMIAVVAVVIIAGGYLIFKPSSEVQIAETTTEAPIVGLASIVDGDKTYTLDRLSWVFEEQSPDETGAPTTRVRLKFEGLKRNGVPIDVGLYRLGTYHGDCKSFEDMPSGYVLPEPTAVAFAQCWFAGGGRQLVVFQEGNTVVVKVRTVGEEDTEPAPLVPILSVDITKIVQSDR